MINFENTSFVTSFASKPRDISPRLSEVLFVGKSNCGKSSLINALVNQKRLAYTSSKPGFTKLLNYFNVDNKFYLVDSPGYGYAKESKGAYIDFAKLMDGYFKDNKSLRLVVLLLDARRIPSEDDYELFNFLLTLKIPYILVLTKIDKLNQSQRNKITINLKAGKIDSSDDKILPVSSFDKTNLDTLKVFIAKSI